MAESDAENRFVVVKTPEENNVRMLLPRQHDGGWPYSQAMLDRIARDEGSVLITGETGTGKELLAYYLHGKSQRSKGPLVAVNCSGLTEERMQAELFGWEKGSFTGATGTYKGRVLEAEGGTLFLDEIAVMDPLNQARLLRFMQTGEIEPIGGRKKRSNVRVIAATNKEVGSNEKTGALIPDLYHRFAFSSLRLPALRDRQSDIFRLMLEPEYLGTEDPFTGITLEAMLLLAVQDWSGNFRELKKLCDEVRRFPEVKHRCAFIRHPDLIRHLTSRCDSAIGSQTVGLLFLPSKEYVDELNATTKRLQQGTPLPGHILHDLRLPRGEELLVRPLDVFLSIGRRGFNPAKKNELNDGTSQSPVSLVWSMHSIVSCFDYTFCYIPEEHLLPLDALRAEFHNEGTNGLFDFSEFNSRMMQPGDRWIPAHWESANCGLADALANMGCYCRRFITSVPEPRTETDGPDRITESRYGLLALQAREAMKLLPPLSRKWGMPKPPRQERLSEEQIRKIESLHFPEPLELLIRVLQLHLKGIPPKQIETRLNGHITATRVRSILRRCGSDFQPLKKHKGGRPPSKKTCA